MVNRGAIETDSTSVFTGCREHQAESSVSFGESTGVTGAGGAPDSQPPVALPVGIALMLRLASGIDSDVAATGDPVSATVTPPGRDPTSGGVLIPACAVARGRISRMEHRILPAPSFTFGIEWHSIEIGGVSWPLAAVLAPGEERLPSPVPGAGLRRRALPLGPPTRSFSRAAPKST